MLELYKLYGGALAQSYFVDDAPAGGLACSFGGGTHSTISESQPAHLTSLTVVARLMGQLVVLVPSPEALFAKELCNLLVGLEAARPRSGKVIVSLRSKKAKMGKIKLVKKYLKSIYKQED
jgi:hypothetical protein